MMKCAFVFLLLFFPTFAFGQSAVIGKDEVFVITPIVFLATGTPEANVFNYFFTLEIFAGMVGLFFRLLFKLFKL